MASQAEGLLSEECRVAINQIASYELHVSDAYLSMSECLQLKARHQYLRCPTDSIVPGSVEIIDLCKSSHNSTQEVGCNQAVPQRPDIDNWGTGKQAIESALQLEKALNTLLQELKTLASKNKETNLSRFMKKFLDEQTRNISYLEYQLDYQKDLEKAAQSEGQPEKAAETSETSGKETTSEGSTANLPTQQVPASAT
ncbi:PREDICTED: ferritin, heavy subunit-like [Lipotes vexillifer]|uniref:Ferritin n=1 Tax=Lipotes vexillifer TaxID=118797 RepID=A0A340XEQ2_LIPVE|nr:PREDICTED: ferritin, heavy subunit-like [Lipotes vexillifer]